MACDGGYNTLQSLEITPHIIIGDMDSIKALPSLPDDKIKIYPVEKDFSDSELSLKHALQFKPTHIYLLAMTGSYFDHSFSNVLNLFRHYHKNFNLQLITENSTIFVAAQQQNIYDKKDHRCSLFFLSQVKKLKLSGFKYQFKQNSLNSLDYSLSNVIIDNKAKIEMENGMVLIILFDKGYH
ncbi:MAG: thiamine diphosphokinase [Spirochaetes bacterium]|nr:thiamine diphosphokinase [Spirochaetota bacterium]